MSICQIKQMEIKVSVIIPTLNRRELIMRALDSVVSQTYPIHEIIVVDNGSTDNTIPMLSENYPFVKILKEKRLGVSSARNAGIHAAKGDWLALLDSDDAWHTTKIERQLDCYSSIGKDYRLIHTSEIWYKNGKLLNQKKTHKKLGGNIFSECVRLCCISPSSSLIRRDIFSDVGYFDEELPACEDYDFWLRLSCREEVLFVDEPLTIKYGGHKDQLSKKYWGMDRFRVTALEKIINQGKLTEDQFNIAFQSLLLRLRIIHEGAKKRKNIKIEKMYWEKIQNWKEFSWKRKY
ncbi:MAG: glycosyltransferase family A protein [Paracoccaceae bacterium]|nr:glycosyltransferase family A protein [Paracoccaceae bacterium]